MTTIFFTGVFALFVFVLYGYLWLARRAITIKCVRHKFTYISIIGSSLFLFLGVLLSTVRLEQRIQSILSILLILSFLMDAKGLGENCLFAGSFDNKGMKYQDIEKVTILMKKDKLYLNYFKDGRPRGRMVFSISLEKLLTFLSAHLTQETQVDLLIDEQE